MEAVRVFVGQWIEVCANRREPEVQRGSNEGGVDNGRLSAAIGNIKNVAGKVGEVAKGAIALAAKPLQTALGYSREGVRKFNDHVLDGKIDQKLYAGLFSVILIALGANAIAEKALPEGSLFLLGAKALIGAWVLDNSTYLPRVTQSFDD